MYCGCVKFREKIISSNILVKKNIPGYNKLQVLTIYTLAPLKWQGFEDFAPVFPPGKKYMRYYVYYLRGVIYITFGIIGCTSLLSSPSSLNFLGILLLANLQPL